MMTDHNSHDASDEEEFGVYRILPRRDGSGTLWELGRGAMGITYKAVDTLLEYPVVLKVIQKHILLIPDALHLFQREARAAARLRHPNIASVFQLGQSNRGAHFFAMEYCDGPTLHERVALAGLIPPAHSLEVALQISKALMAGEAAGVVHRDIKPSNIILTERPGEGMVVKVIDYGVARQLAIEGQTQHTVGSGEFKGTFAYASPEQIQEKNVDIRSDIYSLGVCLWFMLTGRPVFEGTMGRMVLHDPPHHATLGNSGNRAPGAPRPVEADAGQRPRSASPRRRSLAQGDRSLRQGKCRRQGISFCPSPRRP